MDEAGRDRTLAEIHRLSLRAQSSRLQGHRPSMLDKIALSYLRARLADAPSMDRIFADQANAWAEWRYLPIPQAPPAPLFENPLDISGLTNPLAWQRYI